MLLYLHTIMDKTKQLRESVCRSGGAVSKHIRIMAPEGRERGVFVQTDAIDSVGLSDKQTILSIPKSQMVTVQVALESEIVCSCGSELERCNISVNEATLIALFIFTERALGARSPWKTYLDSLPQSGSGALFFGTDELHLLEATPLAKATEAKQRQLSKQYDCCADILHDWCRKQGVDSCLYSFEVYKWAHFVVLSRAISLVSFDGAAENTSSAVHQGCDRALLPALDMFNHSSSPSARWVVENDQSVSVQACPKAAKSSPTVDIDGIAHVELCFSYGKKPNTEWLYEYGFVPKDNENGAWPYLIEPVGSPELISVKRMWMQELGLSPRAMLENPSGQSDKSYISRETLLALCLEVLDDAPSSCCSNIIGAVAPAFPYFSINGDMLVDDDSKLLSVPGLAKHALGQCISRLEDTRHTMLSNIKASADVNLSVRDYLVSEAELLSRIITKLRSCAGECSFPDRT